MNYIVPIKNKYILRTFLRLFENRTHILFIHGCDESYIKIFNDSIEYFLVFDNIQYNFIIFYRKNNIIHLSEYVFEYSIETCLWYQTIDYEDSIVINQYRQYILSHLQNCFYSIDTYWTNTDFLEYPWLYSHMIAFKQKCTPKTKQYIDNFITYLRKKIEKKHVFNKKILKRKFSIWKEWYFNPNNLNGFIKYVKNEYSRPG